MASRRKKRKNEDIDPLGGFSLDQLMGFDLISDPPGPSKTSTIFGAPFKLAFAILRLPFRIVGALLKLPGRMIGAVLPGRKQRD